MPFTWSNADLGNLVPGEAAVRLRYGDSEPTFSGSEREYTTIIALHGTGFNSEIWTPMLPHLASNTRVLALNRRGFAGSTGIHRSCNRLGEKTEAYGRYMLDLLGFIEFAVRELKVLAPSSDRQGGIVLLGWSKGCAFVISTLTLLTKNGPEFPPSHALPSPMLAPYIPTLRKYLKSVILFEPPGLIFGLSHDRMLVDPTLPAADVAREVVEGFLASIPQDKRPLLERAVDSYEATSHDFGSWNGVGYEERALVAERAMTALPDSVGIGLIYCEGTNIGTCIHGARWLEERFLGRKNAAVEVILGGHHFVMATDPVAFAQAMDRCIVKLDEASPHVVV